VVIGRFFTNHTIKRKVLFIIKNLINAMNYYIISKRKLIKNHRYHDTINKKGYNYLINIKIIQSE